MLFGISYFLIWAYSLATKICTTVWSTKDVPIAMYTHIFKGICHLIQYFLEITQSLIQGVLFCWFKLEKFCLW